MTSRRDAPQGGEALQQMLLWLNGHCVEQALHVVARLGIADRLAEGAQSAEALARATSSDPSALYRLLRLLATLGVFHEAPGGHFALTPLGATLRRDGPDSVWDRAVYYGDPAMWAVWGDLHHSVTTGQSAFEHTHALPFYAYLAQHPAVGAPFNRYMTKTSEQHNAALLASYDFSALRTLVDVGGGHGGALAAILGTYPTLQGILVDHPEVVADPAPLVAAGVLARCITVGGDMDQAVPPGGDGYLLKWVLMDRSDDRCVRVLRHCREAMADDGKVLVVEMVLPPSAPPSFSAIMDVQMLLLFGGGRLRTEAEFRTLFAAAGLQLTRVIPTPSPNSILEGLRS